MKIAYFYEIFHPQVNGVLTSTLNLARDMKRMGHEILFVAPKVKGYQESVSEDGIEIFYLPSIPSFLYDGLRICHPDSKALRAKLKKEKIDIIHFTGPFTVAMNAINHGRALNIPVVQTFHTLIAEDTYMQYFFLAKYISVAPKITWALLNYFNRNSDLITAPSQFVIDQMAEQCPSKEVNYISNSLDVEYFQNCNDLRALKKNYPQFNNKTFVFVGRIGQEKSIDIIIMAVAEVKKFDKDIRLFIIGHGPNESYLRSLIQRLDLSKNVFMLGKIENKKLIRGGFLQHARAFITASKTENQPMTILEATACGAPLILACEKGNKELLDGNGIFFTPDNYQELSEKMLLLCNDNNLYKTYKKASLKLADNYNGVNIAKQFEKLYEKSIESIKKHGKPVVPKA